MKTAAAIKRATRQAHNAMGQLDADLARELLRIYEAAAVDVQARIAAAAGSGDVVGLAQLQPLLRQIEDIVSALGQQRDALVMQGLGDAAALGVRPYTLPGVAAVGATERTAAVLASDAAMRVSQTAVEYVSQFVAADGLKLSDRLWRLDRGAREALTRQIEQAVVQGWDAARAAQAFVLKGQTPPADLAARLTAANVHGKGGLLNAALSLTDDKAGALYQAQRVMRTEINRAHGEAYMAGGEGTPGFAGWRYLLSPHHPGPDICDLLSSQNLHGLGPGVYPNRAKLPWPAHPNTLSYVEMVFADEVTDADRAGKETELQALARLAPEVRAGALGQTKAAYFDQGLLHRGMIRSPLYRVKERLTRQGRING